MSVVWQPDDTRETAEWRALAVKLTAQHFVPLAAELDREGRYPWESVAVLVKNGLAAAPVPAEYGGSGLGVESFCAIVEEVSRGCPSTGAILAAYALGTFPLLLEGSEEQRGHYLSEIVSGKAMSFALTEVGAGSDASAIRTTATRGGDGWLIRGEKIYIGNGGASQFYVVFALTDTPIDGRKGITAFIVDKDSPGVVIDRFEDKMGIRGTMTSNLKLDTRVGDDAVLGTAGRGLRLALRTLNVGRISVAAQCVGLGLAAYELAASEATRRVTFGKPIIDNQGISFRLADVATRLSAARMLTVDAARRYDGGKDVSILGAMAKLYASEAAHLAADVAVQVYGGDGYCRPCPAERLYRDQRILEIYEGSSEIQRIVIGRAVKNEAETAIAVNAA
jgi:alkylation response protein AidB-like acyl-CoA dehydrogenase